MPYLDDAFVARTQANGYSFSYADRLYTLTASRQRQADLELIDDAGEVVGYITPYGSGERGAVSAAFFGHVAPSLFRDLDSAVGEILR
jgi:hypothetical protein